MKKNKNDIILMVFVCLNFLVCFMLTLFIVPSKIPVLFDLNEKIVALSSKWILILPIIISSIFGILGLLELKSENLKFFFRAIFAFFLFQNMLIFIYFCFSENLYVGAVSDLPLTAILFLPLSLLIFVSGVKVKSVSFKSPWGFRFKENMYTEFLWKQSHIYASKVMMRFGLLFFVLSVIFSFFHLWLVVFAIFVYLLSVMLLVIWLDAKRISNKYLEMKQKRDNLEKSKINLANETNSQNEKIKPTKNKSRKKISDDAKFF